jgi:hypothetical protein
MMNFLLVLVVTPIPFKGCTLFMLRTILSSQAFSLGLENPKKEHRRGRTPRLCSFFGETVNGTDIGVE